MDRHSGDDFVKNTLLPIFEFKPCNAAVRRQHATDRPIALDRAALGPKIGGHSRVKLAGAAMWIGELVDKGLMRRCITREKSISDCLQQGKFLDSLRCEVGIHV